VKRSRAALALAGLALAALTALPALAQRPQTQTDDYTRYELLEPGSGAFRIVYDVSATTPGATVFYNAIRAGAEEEVHGVTDLRTGRPLAWNLVDGADARLHGHPTASLEGRYIAVELARPVPEGGQGRVRIEKTYVDAASYFTDGDQIVFRRSLGIRRNAIVLPAGYELVAANHPVQVATEPEGRIRASFMSAGPGAVDLEVRARALPGGARLAPVVPSAEDVSTSGGSQPESARLDWSFGERAFEDRDITYFLLAPETSSFRLFHDYTESRPGTDRYVNVVRAGSRASDPEAFDLDTGERLEVEELRGDEIARRGIETGGPPGASAEVVLIRFHPVAAGSSIRLRIWETYTDPARYRMHGEELVWDRNLGRARNTVVLPEGWYLSANAIPGVVDTTDDGLIRIRYVNPRPDGMQVFVKGRRR
jgi:hypothetical protein